MCQSRHINLLAFSGTFSRAKPLTSYKNKSIEFFRLPLLCYYFSVKILGNCTWKLWAYRAFYRQTDATCPHRPPPFPSFFAMCCNTPAVTLALLAFSFPPKFPLISQQKYMSQPYTSLWEQETLTWLPWAVQALPHPSPAGDRALALLADFGDSVSWPAGLGPLIQGQFLPCILPLLLHVLLSFLFFTDTWQKKNNPAPHRHFNNSCSTSVTASLINKYLLEYNHFFLKRAVFRNEITIITCKNMYE